MYIKDEKVYKVFLYIAQVALPALATFYFAIASIWGLPNADKIVGTVAALDALLGSLLMISSHNYKGVNDNDKT